MLVRNKANHTAVAQILSYAFNISQFVSVHCNLGRHTEEVADVKGSLGCNAKVGGFLSAKLLISEN